MMRPFQLLLLLCTVSGFAQQAKHPAAELHSKTAELHSKTAELLSKYVQIPSESGTEADAGQFFMELCRNQGLHITQMGQEDGQFNFMASLFPIEEKRPNVVLLNHIDVVPDDPENTYGPYSGRIEDGYLYGRGAIDNKGVAVMHLEAISRIRSTENYQNSPYNISMLTVSCEESQCPGGMRHVLSNYAEEINAAAVIGEGPSDLSTLMDGDFPNPIYAISRAHKRAYWIKLEIEIEGFGHGSVTPDSYANKEMVAALQNLTKKKQKAVFDDINIQFLKEMAQYKKGMQRLVLMHPRLFKPILVPQLRKTPELFSIFSNTVTLTNINSSSQTINTNSHQAKAGLDCRLLPETNEKEFEAEIRKRLKNEKISIELIKSTPGNLPSSNSNIFYKNLKNAILEQYPDAKTIDVIMPNINDMGYFRALDIPAYGCIPIRLSKSEVESVHGIDERIPLTELETGANVFYIFLKKMIYASPE